MAKPYNLSEEHRKARAERMAAWNTAQNAVLNGSPERREASSKRLTEKRADPEFNKKWIAARWPKKQDDPQP